MKFIIFTFCFALAAVNAQVPQVCLQSRNFQLYKQCDATWCNDILGSSSSTTICRSTSGSLVCSLASVLTSLGKTVNNQVSNCRTLNSFLKSINAYSGESINWSTLSAFGLTSEGITNNISTIKTALCNNKIVVLNVNHGNTWVLARGFNGDSFNVIDPSTNSRSTYHTNEVLRGGIFRL